MKKSQLKAIIKEEIKNVVKEDINTDVRKDYADYKSKWKQLETAFKIYKNNIIKNLGGPNENLKDIERKLTDFNIESDEMVNTYGYDK